jgi:CubicO group peptidase (beta-lactamase class C family)
VEPLYTYGQNPATLRAFILQRAWVHGPAVYSDINFMLLGLALERIVGRHLGDFELDDGFTFRPEPAACAATERCPWRGRVLPGEVHDENAFALGGAAGHAGLFGRMGDVLGFSSRILTGRGWSEAALTAIFTPISQTRTLGWEARHPNWSGGQACPISTIGHTGFTGTGLWIDRERRMAWSLLTNRVHPSRFTESGIVPLRRAVGDAVNGGKA